MPENLEQYSDSQICTNVMILCPTVTSISCEPYVILDSYWSRKRSLSTAVVALQMCKVPNNRFENNIGFSKIC